MIPLQDFTDEDEDDDEDDDEDYEDDEVDEDDENDKIDEDGEIYQEMKVMIVKEVMTGDVSSVAMFFLKFGQYYYFS